MKPITSSSIRTWARLGQRGTFFAIALPELGGEQEDLRLLTADVAQLSSMTRFQSAYPEKFLNVGIAEQNLVSIAAGLAKCGKKPFAASPACFLSTRSYEQAKVDCAYSNTNVTLIGISGGISYGELGMSHHSAQDIAAMSAIPNMRVYLPSDRFQTAKLIEALLQDEKPAYVRVGRNPVEDIYSEGACPFQLDKAAWLRGKGEAVRAAIIACGEMVRPALEAADLADQLQHGLFHPLPEIPAEVLRNLLKVLYLEHGGHIVPIFQLHFSPRNAASEPTAGSSVEHLLP